MVHNLSITYDNHSYTTNAGTLFVGRFKINGSKIFHPIWFYSRQRYEKFTPFLSYYTWFPLSLSPGQRLKYHGTSTFAIQILSEMRFVYYFNPSSATVALILNERDELLVCRRAKEPAKGTLDLPGGFIDMTETGEEGVAREVREETGMKVAKAEYLFSLPNIYIYSGFPVHTLDMFFRCTVEDTLHFEAMDDAADLFFLPLKDIRTKEFGLGSIRKGVGIFLEDMRKNKSE